MTTLYRSASSIDEFYRRAMGTAEQLSDDIEMIFVNDGSPDDSLDRALALHRQDQRVVVVDLARNFGHHRAMMTGLAHARGEKIFLIDSDLEEEPELLTRFYARMGEGDCDVVYGIQEQRKGGLAERLGGAVYFSIIEHLSDQKVPRNLVTARLMMREYVRALVRHRDREFVISHLWAITGFRQVPLVVRKLSVSPSTYSVRNRVELMVKHVTTTSTKLLYLVLYFGLSISLLSACTISFYVIRFLVGGIGVGGWTSLMVSVWFFGGLSVMIMGVIGIYVANIMSETKRRPYTVVRKLYRAPANQVSEPCALDPPDTHARISGLSPKPSIAAFLK